MNNVTFAGRLARNAELKYIPGGQAVTEFSIPFDRKSKGVKKPTLWVRVSAWGESATKLTPYLVKGKFVIVNGELDVREYRTAAGELKFSVEVQARNITLGPGGENGAAAEAPAKPVSDEDIPF